MKNYIECYENVKAEFENEVKKLLKKRHISGANLLRLKYCQLVLQDLIENKNEHLQRLEMMQSNMN